MSSYTVSGGVIKYEDTTLLATHTNFIVVDLGCYYSGNEITVGNSEVYTFILIPKDHTFYLSPLPNDNEFHPKIGYMKLEPGRYFKLKMTEEKYWIGEDA